MSRLGTKGSVGRGLLAAALAAGLLATGAAASEAPKKAAAKPAAVSRGEAVSSFFNRTPEDVDGLRRGGYGYGEIVKIFVVAEMSRRPVPELVERNRKGYGWGTISRELGLHPAVVKKRVDMAREALGIRVHPAPAAPRKAP